MQVVEYDTSVAQQASSDRTWAYKLPHAMNVVARTDSWVKLTGGEDGAGIHEEVIYTYFDGYYDGGDARFRGYTEVHLTTVADTATGSQPASRSVRHYDAGISDRYFNGLMLENRLVKKSMIGVGETKNEVSRIRETRDHPAGRANTLLQAVDVAASAAETKLI